jgi:hypothetical protein
MKIKKDSKFCFILHFPVKYFAYFHCYDIFSGCGSKEKKVGGCTSIMLDFVINYFFYYFQERGSQTTSRNTSLDSRGRLSLGGSSSNQTEEKAGSPPMMKVIAQLWCHECTRTFSDRLVNDEGKIV